MLTLFNFLLKSCGSEKELAIEQYQQFESASEKELQDVLTQLLTSLGSEDLQKEYGQIPYHRKMIPNSSKLPSRRLEET